MPGSGTASPAHPIAKSLFRELSSAAVDAELARLARSWDLGKIERRIGAFKPCDSPSAARKKSFHALRAGSRLQESHAARIQAAFPRSNVLLWWAHPLADVLCNADLAIDDLLAYLKQVPQGRVRNMLWLPQHVSPTGPMIESLTPWTLRLIGGLRREGSPTAFFSLLARLRIEQLYGNLELGVDAADAAWELLPKVVSRSRSLLLSKDALITALTFFLGWQPYADARLWEHLSGHGNHAHFTAIFASELAWRTTAIPSEIKEARKARLFDAILPSNNCRLTSWGVILTL